MAEVKKNASWSVVYETALKDDGSLWYPERLSAEFLESARKIMGTRIFANQYLNECFPLDDAVFKESWFRYYTELPKRVHTVAFIDPAISQEDGADFTGISVVSADADKKWYVRVARRERLTPPEIINLCFDMKKMFPDIMCIGIEDVAFQKALLYMLHEEMQRRAEYLPISGINHGNDRTKEMRIMGALVARMEWGFIYFPKGENLDDVKREFLQFPVAAHDDIIDSIASVERILTYPPKEREAQYEPGNPHNPNFERNLIRSLVEKANAEL
jgi:predicted phage terminase large subunit-like protein